MKYKANRTKTRKGGLDKNYKQRSAMTVNIETSFKDPAHGLIDILIIILHPQSKPSMICLQ